MNPIPTWQSTLGNSPHIVAAGAVGQAMQAEIDALRDRVKELETACDKYSEAEMLLKDFDVRGHPA